MGRQLISVVLLASLVAQAAPPPRPPPTPPPTPPPADLPPPPPPPPPAAAECFPACRPGFFCYQGACRSACNPPCAAGETCLDNGQCAPAGEGAPPPPPPDDTPAGPPPPGGLMVSDDGEQAPPGFHWETQRRKGMLIAGPVLLGIGYAFSAFYGLFGFAFAGIGLTGTSSSTSWIVRNRNTYLVNFVPIAGPAIAEVMFVVSPGFRGDSSGRPIEYAWVIVLSALQVAGGLLIGLGIPTHQVLVEDKRADAKAPSLLDGLSVQWAPAAPGSTAGVSLFGTF